MLRDFTNIKAIFFDTSDTLYKNKELEKAYPEKLVELIAETKSISKDSARQLLDSTTEILKSSEKHVTKVRAAEELGFSRSEVNEKAFCKVKPGDYLEKDEELGVVIAKLAKHYKLGIISNLKKSHILEVLEALGLSPNNFSYFVTEDIVRQIKPAAEPFLKSVKLANCKPDECLYVGDSPTKDMRPAKESGMKTILVAENPSDQDKKYSDDVINNIKVLPNLLV
jgi:putative hydrolase of the HAD superfamily